MYLNIGFYYLSYDPNDTLQYMSVENMLKTEIQSNVISVSLKYILNVITLTVLTFNTLSFQQSITLLQL